jgi:hypothetical protein
VLEAGIGRRSQRANDVGGSMPILVPGRSRSLCRPSPRETQAFDARTQLSAFADELPLCGWRCIGYISISDGNEWCFAFQLSAPAGFREVHGKTPLHQVQYGWHYGNPVFEYALLPDGGR